METSPPHVALANLPTPLERAPGLSERLGIDLRIKRDDLTGSHLSGNKVRKLEYLLAHAAATGATHVITCGGIQSNHCRATALAAAPLGLSPVLLLRTRRGEASDLPTPPSGNVLLGRLAGAEIHTCDHSGYRQRDHLMAEIAATIERRGGRPYIIEEGGSNARGSLGYVRAAAELAEQLGPGDEPWTVVVATGSGGTLAGLALGFEKLDLPHRAIGIPVCDDAETFRQIVDRIAAEASQQFGLPSLSPHRYGLIDGFQGVGYAVSTDEELEFLRDVARHDGLVLDPVYTGKALRGLALTVREHPEILGDRVVFIHTGGIFGLLAAGAPLEGVV